ncbi:MAG: AraC family transcriptional regulator [bacterium]|nr:AraC family transcriptional regulator [bacterium]
MSWQLGSRVYDIMDPISEETLCIRGLGIETAIDQGYSIDYSERDYKGYRFQYTLEGYGVYETSHSCQKITPGKVVLISFPENSHYYFPPDREGTMEWTYFYIDFSGPAADSIMRKVLEAAGPILSLSRESIPIVRFFELYSLLYIEGDLELYYGNEWLYGFLIALLRIAENSEARIISSHISDSVLWMKNNIGNQVNLEEMSESLGISYAHFSRQFAKELGISPLQYMTQLRIRHATHMLLYSDASVTEIACECGFSTANYFTKVFKSTMKVTPSEYRRLNATAKSKSEF